MQNAAFKEQLKVRIYRWVVRLVKYLRYVARKADRGTMPIIKQVMRSGTSIGANYVEAQASPTKKDFRRFLTYALQSANESKYWLAIIRDTAIDDSAELYDLLDEAVELSNILGKSVSTMHKKSFNT